MIVCVAMDSFKGSLSQKQAGDAVRRGILRAVPDAEVRVCAMADGGEGTAEVLAAEAGAETVAVTVHGPLGDPTTAHYAIVPQDRERLCVMEMAEAAGLTLVAPERRDIRSASTFGVGEMILDAVRRGCRRFLIGIGGSATNDCGAGMLRALGFSLLDDEGNACDGTCLSLPRIRQIVENHVDPVLRSCTFSVACDVDNPLYGPRGCSAVYGPQKGAKAEEIASLDDAVRAFADIAKRTYPDADPHLPGSGAAGGIGFAFRTFLGASLLPGAAAVARETRLSEKVRGADLLICGEGRIDGQTAMGKAPVGAAAVAKEAGVPVVALCGSVGPDAHRVLDCGIDAYFPIIKEAMPLAEAMRYEAADAALADTAEQVIRLFGACRKRN